MRFMATYDLMETMRNTNQWLGASAQAFASYPAFAMVPNPGLQWMAAWGEVTERSFKRMVVKPDWGLNAVPCNDGRDHVVSVEKVIERPFGDHAHRGGLAAALRRGEREDLYWDYEVCRPVRSGHPDAACPRGSRLGD